MKIVLCHFVQFVLLVNLSYRKTECWLRHPAQNVGWKKKFWNFVFKQTVIKLVSWSTNRFLAKWQTDLKQNKSEKIHESIQLTFPKKRFSERKKHASLKIVPRGFEMKKKLTQRKAKTGFLKWNCVFSEPEISSVQKNSMNVPYGNF